MNSNTDKKLIEQKSIEITTKALTYMLKGNLLLFSMGQAEIVSLTKLLNTTPDIIALPIIVKTITNIKLLYKK